MGTHHLAVELLQLVRLLGGRLDGLQSALHAVQTVLAVRLLEHHQVAEGEEEGQTRREATSGTQRTQRGTLWFVVRVNQQTIKRILSDGDHLLAKQFGVVVHHV